jgi:DHA2 family multidrug resistance protein
VTPAADAAAPARAAEGEQPVSLRDWVAVFGAILGAFMAVLDIQITNASLQYIQGGLAASIEEGSWISTAYLMAEIIIIPLTSWLAGVFSLRNYLLASCIGFLVFSILCGLSTSLSTMILWRIGQGLTGGALIPTAFSIVLTKLPKSRQPTGLALFGFTATFAPAIGPTIGGWLTINYSWHYIFYVNIIPGLVLIWAVWYGLDRQPMHLDRLRRGDWAGIVTMALGLGSMIAVLEEGERKDWFTTDWIRYASLVAAICIPIAVILELTRKEPFIDLRLLGNRGLGPSSLLGLVLGLGLYGTVYILPVYLAQIQGYDALQIGEVVMWLGLPQLFILPLIPRLMRRFDTRWLVGFGLLLFAVSNLMNAYMTHDTALPQLRWPQLVRALGQPFIIVPLSSLATATIARAQQPQASAIFNIMRNLGGSIGIAMLATFTTIREHYHFSIIADHVTRNALSTQQRLAATAAGLAAQSGPVLARAQAVESLRDLVRREAFVMAYADCFFVMGAAMLVSILALFLIPKPPSNEVTGAG